LDFIQRNQAAPAHGRKYVGKDAIKIGPKGVRKASGGLFAVQNPAEPYDGSPFRGFTGQNPARPHNAAADGGQPA
jgi:hypothetical protein